MTTERHQVVRKGRARASQAKRQACHLDHAALEALSRATYLTTEEAAIYARRYTVLDAQAPDAADRLRRATRAVSEWARVHGIPKCRMGRAVLFLRRDLDEALQPQYRKGVSHRRAS